ncbi:class I SAM-dependent methyltransferase [Thermodesulfitimonas autotrophica]|uniref:class I SAM-dependent methyltransferase n=1 Tax=Thermodesulfitimonas autotrophica TaxID=1894989 RepID=UPI002FDFAC3A
MIHAFSGVWRGCILDVGCRSGKLKELLPTRDIRYTGVDLYPPADVVANLEEGLPFKSASCDVVVALDVLEHTDNIHKAFGELCRVARKYVILSLPNAYEVVGRLKFLFGRPISGKYVLTPDPPLDRHRWLFSLREARNFVHVLGQRHDFEVLSEGCLVGPRRAVPGVRLLVGLLPNLLSPWYLVLLQKRKG